MNQENKPRSHHMAAFIGGLIVGIAITAFMVTFSLPKMMIKVHKSSLSFEETTTTIEQGFQSAGWKVPKIYNLQKSLTDAGQGDVGRVMVFSVCAPEYAYEILKADSRKKITAMMPCRIGVFEDSKGNVYISEMNVGLMSKMFGGVIEKTMSKVAEESGEIMEKIYE